MGAKFYSAIGWLCEWTGDVYRNACYGDIAIAQKDGKLTFTYNKQESPLTHFHYDTFLLSGVMGELPSGIPVHFYAEEAGGKIGALSMPLVTEPGGKLIRFDRK